MTDTIVGIATAMGEGGISIVRISGDQAVSLFSDVFHAPKHISPYQDHLLMFGHILNKDDSIIDEAMGVVMYAPHTYTREDVCELHTHGGYAAATALINRLIDLGARPAEPGEFTRRAFMNGRIDLAQAEAVMGVIGARSAASLKSQEALLSGGTSKYLKDVQTELISLIAGVEAYIDYPEEIDEIEATGELLEGLIQLQSKLTTMSDEKSARILRLGLRVALCGSPNTGKSTLFNALLSEDRAIVTDIPGTTRDVLEGSFSLRGFQVQLMDTAGLRRSGDVVEQIGVERAKRVIATADVALLLIDATKPLDSSEQDLLQSEFHCPCAVLLNKEDEPPVLQMESIRELNPISPVFTISAKNRTGISQVLDYLSQFLMEPREDMLTHQRHMSLAKEVRNKLSQVVASVQSGIELDLVAVDLREALWLLGRITGESVDEKLLDEIFSSFCVGK